MPKICSKEKAKFLSHHACREEDFLILNHDEQLQVREDISLRHTIEMTKGFVSVQEWLQHVERKSKDHLEQRILKSEKKFRRFNEKTLNLP